MIGFAEIGKIEGKGELNTPDVLGINASYSFEYGIVPNELNNFVGIRFDVFASNLSRLIPFYAVLIEYEDMLKVITINNNEVPEYSKKCIPEYLIPKMAETQNRTVCSSSKIEEYKSYPDESRVKNATKYWERMKLLFPKNVSYDELKGIFIYTPDEI